MILAASDTETTGLEPGDHRFVEIYVGLWDLESRTKFDEYVQRINPQRSIAIDAQRVHGISASDVEHSPIWTDVAPKFRELLDRGDVHIGHNWDGFDLPFINYELKRIGLPALARPSLDTMLQGRWATAMGTVPNLGALCWACGVSYDASKAHAAAYDADVMMECVFRGLDWGFFTLPTAEKAMAA